MCYVHHFINYYSLKKELKSMPLVLALTTLLILAASAAVENDLDFFRLLDDRLMYRIAYKPADEFPHELEDAKERLVQITSTDQEQYHCIIPAVSTYSKKRIETYTGPTPAQLIQPIYDESICSYKFESYWNYELCHGRYVLQYHEEKETKRRTEYFLGNFVSVTAAMEVKYFDQLSPPTKKVGDEMRAYYPVTYTHGTVCDITGRPRQTTVLYVCDDEARQNIYSFTEVSSCQYEIIVLSSELCAHPAFQVIPHKEHEISCFPMDRDVDADPKPKALAKIEEEADNQYVHEFGLFKQFTSAKSAKQIFSKMFQLNEGTVDEGINQLNAILESIKKVAQQQRATGGAESKKQHSLASKERGELQSPPSEIQRIVQGFFRGNVCLHGGAGWWKHEVCYGKTVKQYHFEAGKPREDVLLGQFDQAVHKAWASEHPETVVERKLDGQVTQVTHLYGQGDICKSTGAHRSCEVRMRCMEEITAEKVFIHLLEPSTCQYIVVLESPKFCDPLQKVDKYGLLPAINELDAPPTDEHAEQPTMGEQFSSKITVEDNEEDVVDEDGSVKKVRKAKVEIGIINQEDIVRIVQNLMQQGLDAGNGQFVVDMTKIKVGDDDSDEDEELETSADQRVEEGSDEPVYLDSAREDVPSSSEEAKPSEREEKEEQGRKDSVRQEKEGNKGGKAGEL